LEGSEEIDARLLKQLRKRGTVNYNSRILGWVKGFVEKRTVWYEEYVTSTVDCIVCNPFINDKTLVPKIKQNLKGKDNSNNKRFALKTRLLPEQMILEWMVYRQGLKTDAEWQRRLG